MSSLNVQPVQSIFPSQNAPATYSNHLVSRPRTRPVLSCLRCRRRKVKCNRDLPCNQCMSSGHAAECSYHARPKATAAKAAQNSNSSTSRQDLTATSVPASHTESTTHQAPISKTTNFEEISKSESLASIQLRLQNLERLCASHGISLSGSKNDAEGSSGNSSKPDASLSIKSSGPRYHSQSYKKSLFHHFRRPGRFIISGFNDPERAIVWNELRRHYERFTKSRKKPDRQEQATWKLSPILDLLPSREICDNAVDLYFKFFEKTMRILHYPSFMDEYQRFWESDEARRDEFKFLVPQLAIIVAIIYAWEGVSTSGVEKELQSVVLCSHVEEWIETLKGRKQLTMATLRTQALLILSQQVRSAQPDEIWKSTGKLLRSAMVAGLHRDPSEFPDIGVFEGELRRRLWMTIVELDLGASLIYGMPTLIHEGDFTCSSPANVNDVDLFAEMTELPISKALSESTDSTFQVSLLQSLPVRLQAVSGAFNRVEDVQPLITVLEKYIQDLQPELYANQRSGKDPGETLSVVLLHVNIRRVLSHLHHAFISLSNLAPGTVSYGVQSSLTILSYQKLLDTENNESEDSTRGNCWELFHILCKNDIMQAALDICLHIQAPGLVSWTKASLLLAIDDTMANLMRRISKSGSDIKDILRLSVISQMLKSQVQDGDMEEMMKEGAYNVLLACRKAARRDEARNGNEQDMQTQAPPNTQFALENGNTMIDWTSMPNDPLLGGNDLASFLDIDGANYDMLEAYTLGGSSSQSDLWSQY